jgi:hypothetical protein
MKVYGFSSKRVVGNVEYRFKRWENDVRWNLNCEAIDINTGERIAFRGLWGNDREYKKMIDGGIWRQTDIEDYMINLIKPVIKRKITYLKKQISRDTQLLNLLETQI